MNYSAIVSFAALVVALGLCAYSYNQRRLQRFYAADEIPDLLGLHIPTITATIRKELREYCDTWIDFESHLSRNGPWKTIVLRSLGVDSLRADLFPHTSAFLTEVSALTAFVSRLPPGVVLERHRGYRELANNCLRCHLVLTSNARCWIEVDGQTRSVSKDTLIAFDDSLMHSAGNDGSTERTVLIFDVLRPTGVQPGNSTEPIGDSLRAISAIAGIDPSRMTRNARQIEVLYRAQQLTPSDGLSMLRATSFDLSLLPFATSVESKLISMAKLR